MFYLNQQFLVGWGFWGSIGKKPFIGRFGCSNFSTNWELGWNGWKQWVASADLLAGVDFQVLCFFFENSALKTLSPKCWQPLQQKSEEVSENYCTQSQPPFNLKRFGNYSIGDLQISQNGLWLKRLVPIEHHLCGKRATVTSRQFYLIIFLTHFVTI